MNTPTPMTNHEGNKLTNKTLRQYLGDVLVDRNYVDFTGFAMAVRNHYLDPSSNKGDEVQESIKLACCGYKDHWRNCGPTVRNDTVKGEDLEFVNLFRNYIASHPYDNLQAYRRTLFRYLWLFSTADTIRLIDLLKKCDTVDDDSGVLSEFRYQLRNQERYKRITDPRIVNMIKGHSGQEVGTPQLSDYMIFCLCFDVQLTLQPEGTISLYRHSEPCISINDLKHGSELLAVASKYVNDVIAIDTYGFLSGMPNPYEELTNEVVT